MDWENWREVEQDLNNLIDSVATERNIYITATKIYSQGSLRDYSTPLLNLAFYVIHRTRSSTNPTREARIVSSCKDFTHEFDRFATIEEAKSLVESMFSQQQIFFSFDTETGQNLHWRELITGDLSAIPEQASLQNFDDVVSRISNAAVHITREAWASEHCLVEMAITIDKWTVVPQQEFDTVIPHHVEEHDIWDHENPELYREIGLYHGLRCLYLRSLFDDYDPFNLDQSELDHDQSEIEFMSAIEESLSQLALEFGSVPAAKSAVEGLEKFRYEGCSDVEDESKLITCVICMEEVMSGSQLTRLPCSHLYHSDCFIEWLHRNHTCPICRFKLPTQ